VWWWGWRIWWNEDWQAKPKYSEETCPSATLSTTNPTWPDPGWNPGRRGGKPATNRLSYGAAMRRLTRYQLIKNLEYSYSHFDRTVIYKNDLTENVNLYWSRAFRTGIRCRILWTRQWTLGPHERRSMSWAGDRPSASEGFCSMRSLRCPSYASVVLKLLFVHIHMLLFLLLLWW
jgi:hypothetical protein